MRPFPKAEAVSGKELQKFLQTRNPAQDASIAHELDHLRTQTQEYESKQEQLRYDQWWKDPSTAFEKKLETDAHRALKEELEKSDSFPHSSSRSLPCSDGYFDITGVSYRDLSRAAESLSISYLRAEGPDDYHPDLSSAVFKSSEKPPTCVPQLRHSKVKRRRRRLSSGQHTGRRSRRRELSSSGSEMR